ncbi:MAG: hypothetical protein J6V66_04395 [Clostridia bacterium]|nr:hypothetical protein [Clostridia bacterium]
MKSVKIIFSIFVYLSRGAKVNPRRKQLTKNPTSSWRVNVQSMFLEDLNMKKSYLTPSIQVVSYNLVDIVTTSTTNDYAHVKESWLDSDWLN